MTTRLVAIAGLVVLGEATLIAYRRFRTAESQTAKSIGRTLNHLFAGPAESIWGSGLRSILNLDFQLSCCWCW